jgi:hypothetical protein
MQTINEIDDIVKYKAKKAAASSACRLIRQTVDEIEQEKALERKVAGPAFALLVMTVLTGMFLFH